MASRLAHAPAGPPAGVKRNWKGAGYLSLVQAARELHTTRAGVRYLVRSGALRCERDERGYRWFDAGEVRACAALRGIETPLTGRTCARCFEMFDEKKSFAEIVRELAIPPEQVRRLYLEYVTPLGQDVPRMLRFRSKDNARAQKEHAETMRRLDAELYAAAGLAHETEQPRGPLRPRVAPPQPRAPRVGRVHQEPNEPCD